MSTLTIAAIVAGVLAVAFMTANLYVSRGVRRGLASNRAVFKTGAPPLVARGRKPSPHATAGGAPSEPSESAAAGGSFESDPSGDPSGPDTGRRETRAA